MKGKFWRKALAVATSVLMLSGGVPIQPLSQVFEDIAITASAEENVSSSKASSTYVNMPHTGFREYTIPDGTTTFNVYDYSGQSSGYAPRNDSYLLLTAPYGYAMKVSGYVNFSTGGEVPASLRIFNGGTTDSKTLGIYKGRTNVNEEGNSNQLLLYFYNNKYDIRDYSDESGVHLTVDLVPLYAEQAVINIPKSGNKTVNISSETKTIKVYDDGGINGNYSLECNGSLTLTAPENYIFRLSGSIDTEKFFDALYVYDGSSDEGDVLLSRQHGKKTLQTVMSSGQSITLTFSSDLMEEEKPGLDLTVDLVPLYTVSVEGNIAGGKVTLDKESAMEGETVTLQAIPDVGYSVKSVSVNGTAIAPVGGVYSFSMPAENVTVTAEFKRVFSDGIGERLMGYSLSLEGDIGVNFYMELDDSVAANENAYMQFTLPNGDTPKVPVSEAAQKTVGGKTYYVFKCNVAAKEMTDTITAQMIDGEKSGKEYTYSVKDYADYLLSNTEENEEYEKAAPLVKAMLDYGSYAQIYFDHYAEALANGGTDSTDIQEVDADTINMPYDPYRTDLEGARDTTFEGATLSLRSETTLSLYFKSSTDLSFDCYPYEYEVEKDTTAGGYQIARIRGIKAADLDKSFVLFIYDAAESGSIISFSGNVEYCPLTYCYNVLNGGSDDENLQNVCKALYLYWQAAKTYSK